jgi:intermediate filament protein if
LEKLRGNWGKDTTNIKLQYADNLADARKNIDESARQRADYEVKLARLQDDLNEYRRLFDVASAAREGDVEKINRFTALINEANSEAEMLRNRFKQLSGERDRYERENAVRWEELQKARSDLDEETINRIDFQNQVQTLMEELEFLRRVHDQETKELQALLSTQPADTKEFFKNELALAIRDIRTEYEAISTQAKSDMESWYKLKVSEVAAQANRQGLESNYTRDEINRMRGAINDVRGKLADMEAKNALLEKQVQELTYQLEDDQRQYEQALNERDGQLRKMRDECQMLVSELQSLLDTKQMLDTEIAIYRKMLEGEESRAGLRQMVEQVVKSHSLQQQEDTESTRNVRGESSTRTTFQRSAKGNISIAEADADARYIVIENTHRSKEENIGEWKLKRKIDGRKEIVYTFPPNTVVRAGRSCKVWARDQGGSFNPPFELIFDGENSWGVGMNVVTSLINRDGEERANHTQRTIQQGQA